VTSHGWITDVLILLPLAGGLLVWLVPMPRVWIAPTALLIAPNEGHQWNALARVLHKANVELEWFEKYANGRAYAWEKAPSS